MTQFRAGLSNDSPCMILLRLYRTASVEMSKRGARMTKYLDASPPRQSASANRERLAPKSPLIMEEIAQKAADVRMKIARLRELRPAKEAQEVRMNIPAGNEPKK